MSHVNQKFFGKNNWDIARVYDSTQTTRVGFTFFYDSDSKRIFAIQRQNKLHVIIYRTHLICFIVNETLIFYKKFLQFIILTIVVVIVVLVDIASFRSCFAGKCDRQSRDLT